MAIHKQYLKEIKKHWNLYPTWLPIDKVSVGDIGRITKTGYHHEGNLSDLQIPFQEQPGTGKGTFDHSSDGSVSTTIKVAGKNLPGVSIPFNEAGISVKFRRRNGVRFRAIGCKEKHIKNLLPIEKEILAMYSSRKWPRNRVVVVKVIEAMGTTVIISKGRNAQIDLSAGANIGTVKLDLADANIGFGISAASKISTNIIAEKKLTPLFKIAGIVDKWRDPPRFDWKLASAKQKAPFRLREINNLDTFVS